MIAAGQNSAIREGLAGGETLLAHPSVISSGLAQSAAIQEPDAATRGGSADGRRASDTGVLFTDERSAAPVPPRLTGNHSD